MISLLFPLGLLLAAFAALPWLSHISRKGQKAASLLPSARFLPASSEHQQQKSQLEDKTLLLTRLLLILGLALLAASPLIPGTRLGLSRSHGSSLACALVLDDSGSMNARLGRSTRFQRARAAALELLEGAQTGDAFALVLAGAPARLLAPATTDHESLKALLRNLNPSDRGTDLRGALALGRSALAGLPQPEQQLLALTDGAEASSLEGQLEGVRFPLPELMRAIDNCQLSHGSREGSELRVEVGCTSQEILEDRELSLIRLPDSPLQARVDKGQELAHLRALDGENRISLPEAELRKPGRLALKLSEGELDQLSADDVLELPSPEHEAVLGVLADPSHSAGATSERTVVELGLEALEPPLRLEALSLLPQARPELDRLAALLVDDPPGFTPETQEALAAWIERGGVLLVLLGPSVRSAPLGSGFWPLTHTSPRWVSRQASELKHQANLPELETWADLLPEHQVEVDWPEGTRVLAQSSSGLPLVAERKLGLGLVLTSTLPASPSESDFALRPAFLALLDRVTHEGLARSPLGRSEVGSVWDLPAGSQVEGPQGRVKLGRNTEGGVQLSPDRAGLYRIQSGPHNRLRLLERPPLEGLLPPQSLEGVAGPASASAAGKMTSVSRELALGLLALLALELGLRFFFRMKRNFAKTSPIPGA